MTDEADPTSGDRLRRAWTWAGVGAVVVGLATVGLATVLEPWFTWTGHALSDLGDPARTANYHVYNRGMVLVGLLGLAFSARVALAREHPVHLAGAGLAAVTTAALGLVGVFPLGHPLHGPFAATFVLGTTYAVFVHGSGDVLAGRPYRGLWSVWLGIAHVTLWGAYAVVVPWEGIAIPEAITALVLAGWVAAVTRDLLEDQ